MKNISAFIILPLLVFLTQPGEDILTLQLRNQLENYIGERDGRIAVSVIYGDGEHYLGINDMDTFHAASTMKVPVMIEVFRQAEQEKFSLDDSITVKNSFISILDGSEYSMDIHEDSGERLYSRIGRNESIRDLVIEMITRSGNLATNLLIDLVFPDSVQSTMNSLDATEMLVRRGVEDIKAFEAGLNNTTTSRALAKIFEAIRSGRAASAESCHRMLDILLAQEFNEKIPAQLPAAVKVAHKTGEITAISHDSGIIYPVTGEPYILVVLTGGLESEVATKCISEISKLVFDAIGTSKND